MSIPVQRLQPTKLPTLPASSTPEQRFWRSFASPLLIHEYSSITSLQFSPTAPHDLSLTSASLIKLISSKTRKLTKSISRFQSTCYGAQIRRDNRVLAASSHTGQIQIFDLAPGSRAVLRSWQREEKMPIQALQWNPRELTQLVTGGDDGVVRTWELAANENVVELRGHEDYVRSLCHLTPELIASGAYDRTARIWDVRAGKIGMVLRHGAAVEDVLALGETLLLVASGNSVRVWDLVGGKELAVLANHQKTITSLAATGNAGRVLTGALDGHVKVYDRKDWNVVHGIKYPKPILAVAISPDDKNIAVGMVDGLLSIRTRRSGAKEVVDEKTRMMDLIAKGIDPLAEKRKKLQKGRHYRGDDEDAIVEAPVKRKKEKKFEKDLRKQRYADALDRVLVGADNPIILTVLKELVYRDTLKVALAGRDEESLQPILLWCTRSIGDPRLVSMVEAVLDQVLNLYSHALGQSPVLDHMVEMLSERIAVEVENAQTANQTMGMLSMLIAGSLNSVASRGVDAVG